MHLEALDKYHKKQLIAPTVLSVFNCTSGQKVKTQGTRECPSPWLECVLQVLRVFSTWEKNPSSTICSLCYNPASIQELIPHPMVLASRTLKRTS